MSPYDIISAINTGWGGDEKKFIISMRINRATLNRWLKGTHSPTGEQEKRIRKIESIFLTVDEVSRKPVNEIISALLVKGIDRKMSVNLLVDYINTNFK